MKAEASRLIPRKHTETLAGAFNFCEYWNGIKLRYDISFIMRCIQIICAASQFFVRVLLQVIVPCACRKLTFHLLLSKATNYPSNT